jgi:voltage-gated potassium channel
MDSHHGGTTISLLAPGRPRNLLLLDDGNASIDRSPRRSCRRRCWEIVEGKGLDWGPVIFQRFFLGLITFNVGVVIFETEPFVKLTDYPVEVFNIWFDSFGIVLFAVEYLLRLWSCVEAPDVRSRSQWMLRLLPMIDLLAIIPLIIDVATPPEIDVNWAKLLRIFSLLRMERSFNGFSRIGNVLKSKTEELVTAAFIAFLLLVFSSSLMYYLENLEPQEPPTLFISIAESMWWGVAALTTTGYGDITPRSPAGKLLGGVVGFVGVAIFALPAGIIGSGFTEVLYAERQAALAAEAAQGKEQPSVGQLSVNQLTATTAAATLEAANVEPRYGGAAPSSHTSGSSGSEAKLGTDGLEALVLRQAIRAIQNQQHSLATSILQERLAWLDAIRPELAVARQANDDFSIRSTPSQAN